MLFYVSFSQEIWCYERKENEYFESSTTVAIAEETFE